MDDLDKIKNEIAERKKLTDNFIVEQPVLKVEVDKSKSYSEQAKDFVGVVSTKKAIEDEKLVEAITESKKEELLHNAKANAKEEEAKSKGAELKLQDADYGVFSGVATYAGIKKPLPRKMQGCLFGILAVIQTVFLITLGIPTSIINIVADCIDGIVKKLSSITRSAKYFVMGVLVLGIIYGGFLVVTALLQKYNIIN